MTATQRSSLELDGKTATNRASARSPLPHEILCAAYFAVTVLFVLAYGRPLSAWWPTLLGHAVVIGLLLGVFPRLPTRGWIGFLRDWAPVTALTFIYLEVASLNDLFKSGFNDRDLLRVEALLFRSQPSVLLRELLWWKPLSEYLHFAYFSYYALLPALLGPLYLQRRVAAFRMCLTSILLTFFVCYLWFIVYPVAGPWYVFERPDPDSMGWLFPHMEHAVLDRAAAQGAAFPSSHVAAAVTMWLLAWKVSRPIFWVFAAIVPALVVGTVYGGFHYAVDVAAGLLIGIAGFLAGPPLHRTLSRVRFHGSPSDEPADQLATGGAANQGASAK